jgi:hypothetical protein
MWTTDANTPGPAECNPGTSRTWQDALDYGACLNRSHYLGYSDWRLPNRKELYSLADFSQAALPSDNPFTNVQSSYYWSSTTYAYDPVLAWVVYIRDIYTHGNHKSDNHHPVWPVRGGQVPTLIELSSFTATPSVRSVILEWTTESEINNAGFNLYRAESEDGEYVKINGSLIPAEGSATQGASYQFIDEKVRIRNTYYYKLEDIDLNGTSTMHGPVSATPRRVRSAE